MKTHSEWLLILVTLLFLAGCITKDQLRTDYSVCTEGECQKNAIIKKDGYDLTFIEFDDQGALRDETRNQLEKVTQHITSEIKGNSDPVLLIMFIHGWQNNADYRCDNVIKFQGVLKKIAQFENNAAQKAEKDGTGDYTPRKIIGIYAGWRGMSTNVPGIKELTFWDRKNTAEKIGHGAVIDFFKNVESIYKMAKQQNRDSLFAIIGHSFGGDIVYSALSSLLMDRLYPLDEEPRTLGDLIILVNPAFEAMRFSPLYDLARSRQYDSDQLPLLVVLTSESDWATGIAFPVGRFFSTMMESERSHQQWKANNTAIGHYLPYTAYDLLPPDVNDNGELSHKTINDGNIWPPHDKGWTLPFSNGRLVQRLDKARNTDPVNPILSVYVSKQVMNGHSDIFNPKITGFISDIILFKAYREPVKQTGKILRVAQKVDGGSYLEVLSLDGQNEWLAVKSTEFQANDIINYQYIYDEDDVNIPGEQKTVNAVGQVEKIKKIM